VRQSGRGLASGDFQLVFKIDDLLKKSGIDLDRSLLPDQLQGLESPQALGQHEVSDDASGRPGQPEDAVDESLAAVQQRLVEVLGHFEEVSGI